MRVKFDIFVNMIIISYNNKIWYTKDLHLIDILKDYFLYKKYFWIFKDNIRIYQFIKKFKRCS